MTYRPVVRVFVVLAFTTAGIVWLLHKGPVPVIRVMTPLPEAAPFWYMLSAFPVLGMLIADVVDLVLATGFNLSVLELGCQIGLLILLSNLRLGIRLPISGHALLVSYFIFRRFLIPAGSSLQNRIELSIALIILLVIAYPKLVWWTDPITLGMGVGLGLILAEVSRYIRSQILRRIAQDAANPA